ncbi:hypothetical protein, partial [uncultured Maritalea sp.]|uniref:hypothetical protein n=1 Tax=uncultured Maritalea sp. TaxID=757249 RepID=UPI0026027385
EGSWMADDRIRVRDLIPALGFSGLAALLGVVGYMRAPDHGEMAVVFPPWIDSNVIVQSIVQSGAQFVSPSKLPSVFVIRLETEQTRRRLSESGALLFVAAAGICGPASTAAFVKE